MSLLPVMSLLNGGNRGASGELEDARPEVLAVCLTDIPVRHLDHLNSWFCGGHLDFTFPEQSLSLPRLL